jgi:nucleotide-binding universal stress UspA family protein
VREADHVIRRILVALDASPHSFAAMDAAVHLAARLHAELLGLFVEDVDLLSLAESPYAREILYPSAQEAPLTRSSMESKLRAQSEQARKALAAAAEHFHIHWSFRTVRGQVAPEVLAAASEADLLAMGKAGWSFGRSVRMGSTALELAASAIPVFLLPERGLPPNIKLLVHYDGSPAATRRLLAAAQLAGDGIDGMTVLLAAASPESAAQMQNRVSDLLHRTKIEVHFRRIDPEDEAGLLPALKAEKAGVLVLGGHELHQELASLEPFLLEADIPLLVLGDERQSASHSRGQG